jgi:hypothetical protein
MAVALCLVAGCQSASKSPTPNPMPWPALEPSDRAWLAVTCRSDPEPAGLYPQVGHYVCIEARSGNRVRWTAWLATPADNTFRDGRLPGPHLDEAFADFKAAAAQASAQPADSTAERLSIVVEYQPLGGDVERAEIRGTVQTMRALHARATRWAELHDSVLSAAPQMWWFNPTTLARSAPSTQATE